MQVQDFIREYGTKTDEELLQLAIDTSQLTNEANSALLAELRKRRLDTQDVWNFREQEQRQKRKDNKKIGELWFVPHFGLGKRRIGKTNYKYYDAHEVEEFTTTIFFLVFWFPLIPLGTYRIKRQKSILANRFEVIAKLPLNWSRVMQVWAIALLAILILIEIFKQIR